MKQSNETKELLLGKFAEGPKCIQDTLTNQNLRQKYENYGDNENIRAFMRKKYLIKMEEQAIKYEQDIAKLKKDFTTQVEDMN